MNKEEARNKWKSTGERKNIDYEKPHSYLRLIWLVSPEVQFWCPWFEEDLTSNNKKGQEKLLQLPWFGDSKRRVILAQTPYMGCVSSSTGVLKNLSCHQPHGVFSTQTTAAIYNLTLYCLEENGLRKKVS